MDADEQPTGWTIGPRQQNGADYVADVHMHTSGMPDEMAQANARLIAAAPKLADALEAMLTVTRDLPLGSAGKKWSDALGEAERVARAALKAAGRGE